MTQIGLDYTSAVHQQAGIGRYTRELVRAMLATAPAEHAVRLFVADARRANLSQHRHLINQQWQWATTRLTERWLARLWFRLRLPLPLELWTGRLNLFHAPDFILPPTMPRTRTLVTVHDLSFERMPSITMPGMQRHLTRWVPHSVRRADHVIAVSEATRQDLISLYNTPPQKISVLYHGVGPQFTPRPNPHQHAELRQRYGLTKEPLILTVGTVQPRKNYQRLIEAFAALPPNLKAQLAIVGGQGWQMEAVAAAIHQHQLEQRVHFLGYVAEVDLPALYSMATLFVYPSLYEGFGLPALESMACGTPVIASNQSALPEVVGEAGLLVNPYDINELREAMAQLINPKNEAQRQTLAAAGRERAGRFSWEKTAHQIWELYRLLLIDKCTKLFNNLP